MANGQENSKSKIQGLLEIRRLRGLSGQAAVNEWIVTSLECLLEAELARIVARQDALDRPKTREDGARWLAQQIQNYGADSPWVKSQIDKLLLKVEAS